MLEPYQCCTRSYEEYYTNQAGNGLSYYRGIPLQRGSGLGGIFRSMFRMAVPLFKKGAKALGKQFLRTGVEVANDVIQGKDVKSAVKQRAKEAGKSLTDKAANKVKNMIGSGQHKRKSKVRNRFIRRKVRKVKAADIFS